jgi:hypothetical protein
LMIVLNDISKTCQIHFYRQFVAGIYAWKFYHLLRVTKDTNTKERGSLLPHVCF